MRQEELIFLGMARKPKTKEEMKKDPIKRMTETMKARKYTQQSNTETFDTAKEELKELIRDNEGPDIQEAMLKERRDWVQEYKASHNGKPPEDLTDFYNRFNVETPLSPEEEEAKRISEEEESKNKKKKKEEKKKEKKGKKKKKKESEDDDPKKNLAMIGPSEVVQKFDEFHEQYNEEWGDKDESENFKQKHDPEVAKKEVTPEVEDEFKGIVDEMIKVELENMKILQGIKSKKKKKKGKKKKGKKKKGKKKPLPGQKQIAKDDVKDLLSELVSHGIVKKLPPTKLSDFIGEFNYLHSMLDDIKDTPYDPSMALIRQLVTEYAVFPLGSELVKKRAELTRSILFYGPPGTGKTLVVRAIAHETASLVFDLSPLAIDMKYPERKGEEKLVASVMTVAKEFQPSVIYIDECEKVFPAKKKGKKKKSKKDPSAPDRIKKPLLAWKKGFLDNSCRVVCIGCTSEPHEGGKADFKNFFDKKIYFPFPDYSTRMLMWKYFIEQQGGKLRPGFPLSTLAHISVGYSAGSVKKTCEKVLTNYRKKHVRRNVLNLDGN